MELEVSEASKVSQEAAWQVDRQWREIDELRKQLGIFDSSSSAAALGGGGGVGGGGGLGGGGLLGPSQTGPRTLRDVDEALEREEGLKGEHERRREELLKKQASVTRGVAPPAPLSGWLTALLIR